MQNLSTKWISSICKFAQTEQDMLGYKAMKYENDMLISGADSRQRFKPIIGQQIKFPGNGIYLSLSKNYVQQYYTGLHDNEAIITLSFNPKDVTFGNLTDKETEIAVSVATLVNVEPVTPAP